MDRARFRLLEAPLTACSVNLILPWPPSANGYWRPYRGRGLVPSDAAKKYKADVARISQARRTLPIVGPVRVTIHAYRPRRVGDLDNCTKVLLDALAGWAYLDDSQVVELHAYRGDDASDPRVQVTVEGQQYATQEEVAAWRKAKEERTAKARKTRNENRMKRGR